MRTQKNGFWKGLIIGGFMGGVIALLYAPKKGKDLRKDIRKQADALRDGAERGMRTLRKEGRLLLLKTKEKAEAAENAIAAAAGRITSGKERAS